MLPAYQDWWNSSTKFFGIRDDLLRKIDHTLHAYHTASAGSVERRICLADIFVYTSQWEHDNPRSSRLQAVQNLHGAADQDVTADFSGFLIDDLKGLVNGEPLLDWTVRLRLFQTPDVHRPIQPDLDRASEIWRRAGVVVIGWPLGNQPEELRHQDPQKSLFAQDNVTLGWEGEKELVRQANADVGFIHCCYARQIPGGDAAGKTERPDQHGAALFDPLIKIGADLARPETLAHELGHALLNDGSHHFDAMNLMAVGAARKGTELTPGQIAVARRSLYTE